jgi:predicted nucleotidyltransferase
VDDRDDAPLARAPEPEDVARVCRALNDAEVRYVLIGGFAVIAHGGGRFTKDVDLLIDDDLDNVARVKRALAILPDNAVADVADSDVQSYQVVRVVDEIVIDLMGRACGLSYADVVRDAESLDLLGVKVPVASPATLIRTKDTLRPQDAIDRAFLEGVLRGRA